MKKFDIKTGVIGVGSMGKNHARIYNDISNLVGISDIDEMEGKKVARLYNVNFFADYNDLLDEIEAVSIVVPTVKHRDIAQDVFRKGKHVLIEKPLAPSTAVSEEILRLSKKSSIKSSVGHIERHNPIVAKIKELLDAGVLGEIISISTRRVSPNPERIRDVGVVMDLAIHDLDVVRYLAQSRVRKIYSSHIKKNEGDVETHANILLIFENGSSASCEVSWQTPMRVREISLTCTKAYVIGDYSKQNLEILTSNYDADTQLTYRIKDKVTSKKIKINRKEPLLIEIDNFLESISTDQSPLVTVEDGVEAVRLAERALNLVN